MSGGITVFDNIENLKITAASCGTSKRASSVQSKKTNSFVFRTGGAVFYDFGYTALTAHEGSMIFMPQGSSYNTKTLSDEDSSYTLISFEANLSNPQPMLISLENFSETHYICSHFPTMWKFGTQSEKYMCISLFYNLLAYISNIENISYSDKKKLKIIDPAVEHLKKHIFNSSLKVDMLHTMCGVSDTYFRKIFISRFGTSPQKYIMSKRMSQAKSLLDSGEFDTISEVSVSVGYNDPLHFSRIFKKNTEYLRPN